MRQDEQLWMRCPYQRTLHQTFYFFSSEGSKLLAAPKQRCNHTTTFPPLPFPSHHRSSRTLMLASSRDPSPTALHRPRSTMLLVIAPFLTTRRTLSPTLDTSMQILVNCGYRDLRLGFPHGSFVDRFLRRRLYGLSKERERERKQREQVLQIWICFCVYLWGAGLPFL